MTPNLEAQPRRQQRGAMLTLRCQEPPGKQEK
jgi:hypothetical protein